MPGLTSTVRRIARAEALLGPRGPRQRRPVLVGLVRRRLPLRPGRRRVPQASPRTASAAAARRRLAHLAAPHGPRRRQDPVAAEWVRDRSRPAQHRRIALVGPTAADVRDNMVERAQRHPGHLARPGSGPVTSPPSAGSPGPTAPRATTFSAEEPEHLRGPAARRPPGSTSSPPGAIPPP